MNGTECRDASPDSAESLQAMAEKHLPLVAYLVRRFPAGLYEPEELYQQGCIGLMKALLRFRPDAGVAFTTYAVPVILGEMRLLSRHQSPVHIPRPEREMRYRVRKACDSLSSRLGREPTADELSALLRIPSAELALLTEDIVVASSDALSDDGTPLSESLSDQDDWLSRVELHDMLSRLPETDRQLLTYRHLEGLSQTETAKRMGLTQVQISRREIVLRRQLRQMWYDA